MPKKPEKKSDKPKFKIPTSGKKVFWEKGKQELSFLQQLIIVSIKYKSRPVKEIATLLQKRANTPSIDVSSIHHASRILENMKLLRRVKIANRRYGVGYVLVLTITELGLERIEEIESTWKFLSELPSALSEPGVD